MSKNTLQMVEGFSSYQLVFGRNPNLPNLLEGSPSSLEEATISHCFQQHINCLHAARKAFIESEASIRIKKALHHKIRSNEVVFDHGDKVYYKRDQGDKWIGPAKVIFQDGKVIFIRHCGVWIKASPNRVVKSGCEFAPSGQLHSPVVTESLVNPSDQAPDDKVASETQDDSHLDKSDSNDMPVLRDERVPPTPPAKVPLALRRL